MSIKNGKSDAVQLHGAGQEHCPIPADRPVSKLVANRLSGVGLHYNLFDFELLKRVDRLQILLQLLANQDRSLFQTGPFNPTVGATAQRDVGLKEEHDQDRRDRNSYKHLHQRDAAMVAQALARTSPYRTSQSYLP